MATARGQQVHNLSSLLDALQNKIDSDQRADAGDDDVTFREVLEVIGRRAYGPLLLVVGLISISPAALIPGSTWLLAIVTLLVSAQMMLHRDVPWMPRQALEMKLSENQLGKFIKISRPVAKTVDKVVRPRLQFLAQPPWIMVIALLCIAAALVTFPLGLIPIAPFLPGLAVTLFGLGVTARDGLLLTLGGVVMTGSLWLLFTRVF